MVLKHCFLTHHKEDAYEFWSESNQGDKLCFRQKNEGTAHPPWVIAYYLQSSMGILKYKKPVTSNKYLYIFTYLYAFYWSSLNFLVFTCQQAKKLFNVHSYIRGPRNPPLVSFIDKILIQDCGN